MKKHLFYTLLGLICFSIGINAQEINKEKKHRIGLNTTFLGDNDVFTFESLAGAGNVDGNGLYSLGVSYAYILNKRIELQSGLDFSIYRVTIEPAYAGEEFDHSPWNENIKQLTIPLTVNVNFGKYFFINGGFLLDFEVSKKNSIDKQSGLGAVIGIGFKYDFDSGIFILANPYYKLHSLIPFSSANYQQHLQEYGLKIGVGYSF